MLISVLLPTRGRKEPLLNSIKSLLDLADKPDQIELLLGMDNDDLEHIEYVQKEILPNFPNASLFQFNRLGYKKLNMYVNTLAGLSKGHWIFVWNDDAIMQTKGWDTIIHSYNSHPMPLLRTIVAGMLTHPFSIFPIIKRKWYEIVGAVSLYTHVDRFVYNVNSNIDWPNKKVWVVDIPVHVIHDRYDLTGNNKDETFETSIKNYNEGHPENPISDDYEPAFNTVLVATNKLIQYMNDELGARRPLLSLKTAVPIEKVVTQSHGVH